MSHIYPDCLVSNRLIGMIGQGRTTRRALELKNGLILLNTSRIQLACVAVRFRPVSRGWVDRGVRNWVFPSPHVWEVASLLLLLSFLFQCIFDVYLYDTMNDIHMFISSMHQVCIPCTSYDVYVPTLDLPTDALCTETPYNLCGVHPSSNPNTPCRYVQGPPGV